MPSIYVSLAGAVMVLLTGQAAWTADVPDSKDKYVAIFNTSPLPSHSHHTDAAPASIVVSLKDLGLTSPCRVRDLWAKHDLGQTMNDIRAVVVSHGAVLYRVQPTP